MFRSKEAARNIKLPVEEGIKFYQIDWVYVVKRLIINSINSAKECNIMGKIILLIIFFSLLIGLYNIYSTIKNFFKVFFLKKKILLAVFGSRFAPMTPGLLEQKSDFFYKTYIYNFEELLITLIWKFLNGLLIIIPILLIVAYSTLLERKVLSSIQK